MIKYFKNNCLKLIIINEKLFGILDKDFWFFKYYTFLYSCMQYISLFMYAIEKKLKLLIFIN